ncbi:MAG: 1-acyl-sn-glycerol-3-phosphate acyltransferase [Nitrosomonas sp. PRO5]|nr:1-acyl-sn-glycerol-3-phosphate acyltransferase [Nitrosomonas sp. PRO5]
MAATGVNRLTRSVRFIRLILHITSGLLQSFALPYVSTVRQNRMACNWAQKFLRILKVKLCPGGVLPVCGRQGVVFVANHISWLDIMVILAVYPVHFVAKAEIGTWPILGRLCRNAGTLFIDRKKRGDTLRINQQISSILKDGRSVVIFPEGTTGDGNVLQHFHASLLQSAVTAETLLYPVAIRYRNRDGSRNSSVAYVSVTILQSLMQILAEPEIQVELIFREPIPGAGRNRRELARLAEKAIAQTLSLNVVRTVPETLSDLPAERM